MVLKEFRSELERSRFFICEGRFCQKKGSKITRMPFNYKESVHLRFILDPVPVDIKTGQTL